MGKRELFIICAFAIAAFVVYQVSAPPPKEGERGFSLGRLFSEFKRELSSDSSSATTTKTGTVTLSQGVTELRLTAIRAVPLTVVGERRTDVGYELSVKSTGPDDATALEYAERAKIVEDDLGEARAIGIWFPKEGQQTGRLTLHVPHGLLVRIENAGSVNVSNVRAVDLRNLNGDATIANLTGELTGSHRNGELNVTGAAGVELTLSSSRAKFTEVAGSLALKARNGDCTIAQARGPVDAEMLNVDVVVVEPTGTVRISGESGTLKLLSPAKAFTVDVRRMLVEITLGVAVPATIMTTDEPLRLSLTGPPGVGIDAAATDGTISAKDFDLMPTAKSGESRLAAQIGGGGPRLLLRNTRGDIVISLRK